MTRSSVPARLAPALLLLAVLAGSGCASLTGEGRLAEAEAGPGAGQTARLLRMADDAAAAGDPATAANLYARVLALEPNDRVAARRLGEALLRAGRWQEAIDAFRRVVAADPGEPEASRGLARALLAIGRPEAALAALEGALPRAPDDPRLVNAKGVALDQLGRHEEAQAIYRAGLTRWPENPSLRNNLGLSLALAGRYGEAIGELEPLARGPQETPRARHNLAAAFALKGDLRAAEALLKLDLDDKDVRSTLAYYTALRGLGSPRTARGMLRSDPGPGEASAEPAARLAARNQPSPPGEPPFPILDQPFDRPAARTRLRAPESEPATTAARSNGARAHPLVASADPASAASGAVAAGAPAPVPTPARADRVTTLAVLAPDGTSSADDRAAAAEPASPLERTLLDAAVTAARAAGEPGGVGPSADREQPAPRSAALSGQDAHAVEGSGSLASLPAAPASAARALPAVPIEPARGGDWVVELGVVADGEEGRARWRELRRVHGEALTGVARLGGDAAGGGPLLAGPFTDRAEAERACARLAAATECRVNRL